MVIFHTALHIFQLIQYCKHVDKFAQCDQIRFRDKVFSPLCMAQASHLPTKPFNCISLTENKRDESGSKSHDVSKKDLSHTTGDLTPVCPPLYVRSSTVTTVHFGAPARANEKHHRSRKTFKACEANNTPTQPFQLHLCVLQVSYRILAWHNWKYD